MGEFSGCGFENNQRNSKKHWRRRTRKKEIGRAVLAGGSNRISEPM
jgi:hypothetical protein